MPKLKQHQRPLPGQRLLAGSIYQRQIEMETGAVRAGVRAYEKASRDAIERGEGSTLPVIERLLRHWYVPLRDAIRADKAAVTRGAAKKGDTVYGPALQSLPARRLAVITMHESVSACMLEPGGVKASKLCGSIGRAVFAEINAGKARASAKQDEVDSWRALVTRFKSLKPRKINWWARKNLEDPSQGIAAACHVGAILLHELLFTASTQDYTTAAEFVPAFVRERRRAGRRTTGYVMLTDEAWALIENGDAARSVLRPRHLPMLIPPLPAGKGQPGGYIRNRTSLVIKASPEHRRKVEQADMPELYEGFNALGAAPLRINRRVMQTMLECWERGITVAEIPDRFDMPKLAKPDSFADEEAEKAWRREAVKVHRHNIRLRGRRAAFLAKLNIAAQFMHEAATHFPHHLDFRSRAYPEPLHLHYQGDDICRGMLEFAVEKNPDTMALQVHAANCWGHGFDKGTFDQRGQWTRAQASEISRAASRPLESVEFWSRAEDPWQFLAACMALDDPASAGARLPVSRDGSCNGLQHYAALGRDAVGAEAVNITDTNLPADLYGRIAAKTKALADERAAAGDAMAMLVAPLVDRSAVKQPVMTQVYGVTKAGARGQIVARLRERGLEGKTLYQASAFLADLVLEAIGEICGAARRIMDWLSACARQFVDAGRPVEWVTPLGFPAQQSGLKYRSRHTVLIRTVVQEFTLPYESDLLPIRPIKQVRGIAPNFIHSIDASHMFMVAAAAWRSGIHFAPVHDSFATHAHDWAAMGELAAERFTALHRQPILANLREQWVNLLPESEIPELPACGTLDIESCARATRYMFA